MVITILSSIVAGLVLALIILSIKFTSLRHELKLVERENESLRKKILEPKERHEQEVININKKHLKAVSKLKKEIDKLQPIITPEFQKKLDNQSRQTFNIDDKPS